MSEPCGNYEICKKYGFVTSICEGTQGRFTTNIPYEKICPKVIIRQLDLLLKSKGVFPEEEEP